jgi:hypothetical protein
MGDSSSTDQGDVATPITKALLALMECTPHAPVKLSWGLHQPFHGARWLVIHSTGLVEERTFSSLPGHASASSEVGRVATAAVAELARALLAGNYDRIRLPPPEPGLPVVELIVECETSRFSIQLSSPMLARVPALAEIERRFRGLRDEAVRSHGP